jgi:hypothetical protein
MYAIPSPQKIVVFGFVNAPADTFGRCLALTSITI